MNKLSNAWAVIQMIAIVAGMWVGGPLLWLWIVLTLFGVLPLWPLMLTTGIGWLLWHWLP